MLGSFQAEKSFESRVSESAALKLKYYDRVPVIVERRRNDIAHIDKRKFLVPDHLNVGQLIFVIRRRLKLEPHESVFVFVNHRIVQHTLLLKQLYEKERDPDGFVYLSYDFENTFG